MARTKIRHEWIDIHDGAKKVHAWIEYPDGEAKAPVVIVMPYEVGVDDWTRSVADELATAVAACNDPAVLTRWLARAATVASADQILADGADQDPTITPSR